MIRPLRQRHRRIVITLAIILPAAFVLGIVARKPIPITEHLPSELTTTPQTWESIEWQRGDLFPKSPIQVRLWREHLGAGKLAVSLSAAKNFVKPDLLVYWSAGSQNITDALPANAILLGAFSSSQLHLPAVVDNSEVCLILFSLADNEIVDVTKPIRLNHSTR